MIKPYKGRHLSLATRVFAYRNLHQAKWSIRAESGPYKGKVVAHADEVMLWGCQLKVSEAGRQRVAVQRRCPAPEPEEVHPQGEARQEREA